MGCYHDIQPEVLHLTRSPTRIGQQRHACICPLLPSRSTRQSTPGALTHVVVVHDSLSRRAPPCRACLIRPTVQRFFVLFERNMAFVAHAWRSMLFTVEGWQHYLKAGYEARSKHFDDAPFSLDLSGKHCLVTGANQGIGFETSKRLAAQRATVHMVCRNKGRGETAAERIRKDVDGANVRLHVCDLSSMVSVTRAARRP